MDQLVDVIATGGGRIVDGSVFNQNKSRVCVLMLIQLLFHIRFAKEWLTLIVRKSKQKYPENPRN